MNARYDLALLAIVACVGLKQLVFRGVKGCPSYLDVTVVRKQICTNGMPYSI